MKKSSLIKKYGKESRWVFWKLQTVKGKQTKVPYNALTGMKASSTDPATWTTASKVPEGNIGIVLHDKLLFCIDIDHILVDGSIRSLEHGENIVDLVMNSDTYTEISQSGTGLHLFFALTEPLELTANKKAPYEVYTNGRYIAVTGNSLGEEKEVRTITPAEALEIIEKIVPQKHDTPAPESVNSPITAKKTSVFNDAELLSKMFGSKSGSKIQALFDGDLSAYKDDASSADMALCSHLAFWSGKDTAQIERLWLQSALGKRDKLKRKDYRDRTISAAVLKCKEVYKVSETSKIELLFTLNKDDKKIFTLNTENIYRVIIGHEAFFGTIRYDEFKNTLEIHSTSGRTKQGWRELTDSDTINIQTKISVLFPCFGKVGKQMVFDAIIKVAKENAIDSAVDYIKGITWDGEARLDQWLTNTYGTPDDEYHRAVASNWVKGMIKRLTHPGCKFDYVLVLEGNQGVKKSTSLGILGGDWHVETAMSTDSKDFFMQFAGKSIIEFSEGETLSRTEVKRMKAIITMQNDRYRLPYERTTQDFPRRCVFAMTTNQTEYLKDETGNRRWLPVTVMLPEANIQWLADNRDQLFAEAYYRVVEVKETIYEFPTDATLAAQRQRMIHDPNEDVVEEWYGKLTEIERYNGITIHQVYKMALHNGFAGKPMTRFDEMMIGEILTKHMGLKKERKTIEGIRSNRYFDPKNGIPSDVEININAF